MDRAVPDLQPMCHVFQEAQSLGAEAVSIASTPAHCFACWLPPQKAGSQDGGVPARAHVNEPLANAYPILPEG